jgi:competence protein ComGC
MNLVDSFHVDRIFVSKCTKHCMRVRRLTLVNLVIVVVIVCTLLYLLQLVVHCWAEMNSKGMLIYMDLHILAELNSDI